MDKEYELNKKVNSIDFISLAISELMPIIQDKDLSSENINHTLNMVLRYTRRLTNQLPEILISSSIPNPKTELINAIDQVISVWNKETGSVEELSFKWEEFVFWWKEFQRTFKKMQGSERTIILSLN